MIVMMILVVVMMIIDGDDDVDKRVTQHYDGDNDAD